MKKEYRVRYGLVNGRYGFVSTSGEELTEDQARNRTIEYLEANGIPYTKIVHVYEIEESH